MPTAPVTAAGIPDRVTGGRLLNPLATPAPGIRKGRADRGHREHLIGRAARPGIDLDVIRHTPATRTFIDLPRRRAAEHTPGRLMHHRHVARDDKTLPAPSTAMNHIATTALKTRRLTHTATPT
ncbi:hypothetical protein ACFVYR_38125 [Streptomyces sp. NPDC058284]|uniref:hypothetical protein n=1 Tax=unclassified Streptomyces TaxID=2593676 RepID=UPI00365E8488